MANKKLKERCHYYRRRKGYSQRNVAVQLNVTASALSKWEHGHIIWPLDALNMYCELLELDDCERQELLDLTRQSLNCDRSSLNEYEENDRDVNDGMIEDASIALEMVPAQISTEKLPLKFGYRRWINKYSLSLAFIIVGFVGYLMWNEWKEEQYYWQETFDPIQKSWGPYSADLEDVDGTTAVLKENSKDNDFGKIESEIIRVDVDKYPIMRMSVENVDTDASFTVQILDKRSDTPKDILSGITYSGDYAVNLKQELEWQGMQAFTINIWISGEGKSVQLNQISIEKER